MNFTGVWILLVSLAMYKVSGLLNGSQRSNTNAIFGNINSLNTNTSAWFPPRKHGRNARSISTNCNTWSTWIDENHPTASNKNDNETITTRMRGGFCPNYGNTDKFQCQDNNGEPYTHDWTGTNYEVKCGKDAVTCTLTNMHETSCPDVGIRFFCSCPVTRTPATSKPLPTSSVTASLTTKEQKIASGRSALKSTVHLEPFTQSTKHQDKDVVESSGKDYLNIAGLQVQWWIVILTASFIMFTLNLTLTLCLYKKMRHHMQHARNKDKKVHPLSDI